MSPAERSPIRSAPEGAGNDHDGRRPPPRQPPRRERRQAQAGRPRTAARRRARESRPRLDPPRHARRAAQQLAERAVLIPVGAALEARDRVAELVTTTSSRTRAGEAARSASSGAAAAPARQLEREVRRTRTQLGAPDPHGAPRLRPPAHAGAQEPGPQRRRDSDVRASKGGSEWRKRGNEARQRGSGPHAQGRLTRRFPRSAHAEGVEPGWVRRPIPRRRMQHPLLPQPPGRP